MIKMILVKPEGKPEIIEVEKTLESMQKLVGGLIEYVPLYDDIDVVVNDEGKLLGLPINRYIMYHGHVVEALCGNIILTTANDEGETISLSQEQIDKYLKVFASTVLVI